MFFAVTIQWNFILIWGGFGIDFSSDAEQINVNVEKVAKNLVQFGVTSFCPTVVTSAPDFYKTVETCILAPYVIISIL